jgi:hypothetical protein
MTTSQLFSGSSNSSNSSNASGQQDSGNMKRLFANTRADVNLASSAACLATATSQPNASAQGQPGNRAKLGDSGPTTESPSSKKTAKNKRIISRMLSISAIHTTVGSGASSSSNEAGGLASQNVNTGLSGGCLSDDNNQANEAKPIGGTGEQQ